MSLLSKHAHVFCSAKRQLDLIFFTCKYD